MATQSAASTHATHAARTLIPPTAGSCSIVSSIMIPLYLTTVSKMLPVALRMKWIEDSYLNMANGKYEETIQFGWSTISEIFRSTTRLAST
jgi:hypothetical protein